MTSEFFAELQRHSLARDIGLPQKAADLMRQLRAELSRASDEGLLKTSRNEIIGRVKLLEPSPRVQDQLRAEGLSEGAKSIWGGEKNFDRVVAVPHFVRDDEAWFDFTITVRESNGLLVLLAYDFELRMPCTHGTPFVRFDLNLPGHDNDARELRCHLHPGTDDLLLPAPYLSPIELIRLFIRGLRRDGGRKPRARSIFETEWLRAALALSG